MGWLMDYHDALTGELGEWWQKRAEQHAEEIFANEIPGKWWTWRNVRERESAPTAGAT